jgi:hypothetical protein
MSEDNTEQSNEQIVADSIGRPENVPEKFWNDDDKSVRHDDVLKSYNELSSKFGGFTGAPDNYEFAVSDQLKEAGIDLDMESPMLKSFMEMAKEGNMSQDMAGKMINMFLEDQHAGGVAGAEGETARQAEEMAKLGENAVARVNNVEAWAKANIPDHAEGLADAATSAAGVMAIEALIAKTRNASVNANPDEVQQTNTFTLEDIHKLQFEKDEFGNKKMSTDPEHRKKVEAMYTQLYPGGNNITVG